MLLSLHNAYKLMIIWYVLIQGVTYGFVSITILKNHHCHISNHIISHKQCIERLHVTIKRVQTDTVRRDADSQAERPRRAVSATVY